MVLLRLSTKTLLLCSCSGPVRELELLTPAGKNEECASPWETGVFPPFMNADVLVDPGGGSPQVAMHCQLWAGIDSPREAQPLQRRHHPTDPGLKLVRLPGPFPLLLGLNPIDTPCLHGKDIRYPVLLYAFIPMITFFGQLMLVLCLIKSLSQVCHHTHCHFSSRNTPYT